jgi:hypothetical protein
MYKLDKNNKISINLINGAVAKDVSAPNFPLLLMYICGNSFRFLSFKPYVSSKNKKHIVVNYCTCRNGKSSISD